MTVLVRRCVDAVVVTVRGDVDIYTAALLEQRVLDWVRPRADYLIVDLSRVDFLDAHGLSALLGVRAEVTARQGRGMAVVARHHAVVMPLTVTGLDEELNLRSDLVLAHAEAIIERRRESPRDAVPR